jgi:hypothetical protein
VVLPDFSVQIPRGAITGLLGPSGIAVRDMAVVIAFALAALALAAATLRRRTP